ncbi:MAG: Uncharacterized protein LiPW39_131 [Parcubacteria group bacterium LiPW_39]|nr:MAG: Uncharacterized protein LiPW39_131 [Parcubacteria group bacterium LiPW_39]
MPAGITASRLLLGHVAEATPLVVYTPAVNSKEFIDLEDGVWYFHVQLRNASGWGGITHFRLQIDTQPPKPFAIEFIDGESNDNPTPKITFGTIDETSGIDRYEIKIGNDEPLMTTQSATKKEPFILPPQSPGKKTIVVEAFDKAGNSTAATKEFIIKALEPPTFSEYPKQLHSDEIFQAKGETYSDSQVTIWLQREKDDAKSQIVKSDKDGNFVFVADEKLEDGFYKLWGEVTDERGARSNPSDKIAITVTLPLQIRIGKFVIDYITIINLLLTIVIGLVAMILFIWYRVKIWRRRVRKETIEARQKLHRAFSLLAQEVKKQVAKTDGQEGLSERESAVADQLKKALEVSEKIVGKEIKDIERELKK